MTELFDEVRIFLVFFVWPPQGKWDTFPIELIIIERYLREIFRFRDMQTETNWPVANIRRISETLIIFLNKKLKLLNIYPVMENTSQKHRH